MEATSAVGWLADGSVEAVGAAVAALAPELAGAAIVLTPGVPGNPPQYWKGTARVGARHVAKFAWSAEAAVAVDRELAALSLLAGAAPSLPLPEVVHASRDPVLFLTRLVPGVPGGDPYADDPAPSTIPEQLAEVLATLHHPALKGLLEDHRLATGAVEPQATTGALRDRFAGTVVTGDRARRVRTWCDWVEDVQRRPVTETTVVHGDLHTHNLVLSEDGARLRLLADLEHVAVGDPAYDFRYLVAARHDLGWFLSCHEAYQRASGRRLALAPVLAWHIRTALGDALWRTERGLALPGGLTPDGYVDDITRRLHELAITTS